VDAPELDELWTVLAGLAPRRRAAVVLRYYEDLPVTEIARLLDCRPGTVSSLLHRGLADLREVLDRAD
jgi:RNA polymerase sigma factor (sigma-70 family)